MTGKERILAALAGAPTDQTPVGIDYLFLYLAERMERAYVELYRPRLDKLGSVHIDPEEDVELRLQAFLSAHATLAEQQDWMTAFPGPSRQALSQRSLLLEDGKVFQVDRAAGTRKQLLLSGQESKTEEYRERFEKMQQAHVEPGAVEKLMQENRAAALSSRGDMRLVQLIARERGAQEFLYTGAGAPFWSLYGHIGFEGMMTALHDAPDLVMKMMDQLYQFTLEDAQAFKDAGGHGVRVEECLASGDIISQRAYERFALPYEERLFSALRRMGLKVILYFCGDVMPRLSYLRQLPIDALIVEESKKDFTIDIGAVRAGVGPRLCLWGNVDIYEVVQRGTESQLDAELARRQRVAGSQGAFVAGVGSPLPLDLSLERADLFTRLARRPYSELAR